MRACMHACMHTAVGYCARLCSAAEAKSYRRSKELHQWVPTTTDRVYKRSDDESTCRGGDLVVSVVNFLKHHAISVDLLLPPAAARAGGVTHSSGVPRGS